MKDKVINDKALKDIRSLYRLKNKQGINNKILRDIRSWYESYKEDYYKPIRIGNAFSSNYIKYESNDQTMFMRYNK